MAKWTHSVEEIDRAIELARSLGSIADAAKQSGMVRETLQYHVNKSRRAALAGAVGGPPIPAAAVPPVGFVVASNSSTFDADGNLKSQSIKHVRDAGEVYEPAAGHVVKGESVLVDADGRVTQRWVKTALASADQIDGFRAAFAAYDGASVLRDAPAATDDDLLTVYPLADLHVGLYSWGAECGADYDVDIATDLVRRNINSLVAKSEPSKAAVILGLGDLFHQNDQKNATPQSGHRLDVDGRWQRVFEAGAKMLTHLVDIALQKHEIVHLVAIPGNHDEDASVCLRVAMSLFYSNNPRVKVYTKPGLHWYMRFGKCLLAATHGHTMKPDRMAMMLATDCQKDWGETDHKHMFFGHIHHETAKEVGPVRLESFNTPAAKDAYATGGGYRSSRSMSAITFHAVDGEAGRHRVNIPRDWATVRSPRLISSPE